MYSVTTPISGEGRELLAEGCTRHGANQVQVRGPLVSELVGPEHRVPALGVAPQGEPVAGVRVRQLPGGLGCVGKATTLAHAHEIGMDARGPQPLVVGLGHDVAGVGEVTQAVAAVFAETEPSARPRRAAG